jgi:hypothetical protein
LRITIDDAYLIPGIEDNQICLQIGCTTDEIDLVYDKASEATNTMRAEDKDVLDNIRYDPVLLKGVGDSIRIHEADDFTFGKRRIGTDYNLVSQYESGKIWQLVNPVPDKFYLNGWEGTG